MQDHSGWGAALTLQGVKRLPGYYHYLRKLQNRQVAYVASPQIAREMNLNEVQVRKDLAAVSRRPGKPRKGFEVDALISSIGEYLGYHQIEEAVLVGAGRLGKALLSYKGFEEHGVRIVAAFDLDKQVVGTIVDGIQIDAIRELPAYCKRQNIRLGIITAPAEKAQGVCNLLVKSGILAIWNFAPVHLHVPENVLVQHENMAVNLAVLSRHLNQRLEQP